MDRDEKPERTSGVGEFTADTFQNNKPGWHVYLEAAVRRQQQLACLNERLARFLRFANDVDYRSRHQGRHRSFPVARENSLLRNRGSARKSGNRAPAADSSGQNSFEIEELEEKKTQSFRNSLELYDIRIDTLRRAMNSLNRKNEELMQNNAELRFLNAEANFELRQLKDENEKLKGKIQRTGLTDRALIRSIDHEPDRIMSHLIQQENRRLKARLDRQKQELRKGLDGFISRSIEALQNGGSVQNNHEKLLAQASGDEREQTLTRTDRCTSSSRRSSQVAQEQVNLLEEHLQSVTDELEHERFRSERKTNLMQEILNRSRENLTRKENELQQTNEELEAALGALQSLIQTGDETQKELDVYRRLVDREESRLYDGSDDSSGVSSSASEASFRSAEGSAEADLITSLPSRFSDKEDFATSRTRSLEIGKHDVRRGKFVILENKGDEPLDISRWYLVQQCGNNKVTHRFPSPFIIKPRCRVVLWSADAKATHQSPTNYVMPKTVLPWCDSGEVDLITKVYDRLGNPISKRETRVRLRAQGGNTTRRLLQDPKSFLHELESHSCSIS